MLAVFLAFYVPGIVVVRKAFASEGIFERTMASLVVGIVFWTYQALVFGYLNIRVLSYLYLIIFFVIWFRQQKLHSRFLEIKKKFKNCKINWIILTIFTVGIFGQTQQFFIAGQILSDGIRIFSQASDDAYLHLALIAQIVRRIPPIEPGLAGTFVHNYHYLSNIVIGELIRVFHLPLLITQFQYMYIFTSFLLGGIVFSLARILKFSFSGTLLFVYFQYFSSDIIYLLTLVTNHYFEFGVHPLEAGTMFLENPPRAFAAVVALGGTMFLVKWLQTKRFTTGIIASMLFGSLIGFKVHTGIPVVGGLAVLGLYFVIIRQWRMLFMPILTTIISFFIYFSVNANSGLIFLAPFEMTRMFAVQKNLYLSSFELARRIYADHNNFLQELRMDITMLVVFLVAQFGLINFGFIPLRSTVKHLGIPTSLFFYSCIAIALILGTFFYQPVAGADIFNFYLTASLFLSLFSAFTLSNWFDKRRSTIKIICIIALIACSIPRWIYFTYHQSQWYFIPGKPVVWKKELESMKFVSKNTGVHDIILVANSGQWDSMFPYVSAFTQRDMYLSGQTMLGRHGISFQDRTAIVDRILTSEDVYEVNTLLKSNKIDILYFYGNPVLFKGLAGVKLKKIFQNESNTIYAIK